MEQTARSLPYGIDEAEAAGLRWAPSRKVGVHIAACKACADQLGVTETLEELGSEVIYWGVPLTDLLKNDEKLITI
jgi:hypothetical protein